MIVNGNKITSIMVSAANGDTYGDAERKLFRGIQSLVLPNVISMVLNTPPASPTFGQTYVVGTAPSGAWAGQANSITAWAIDPQDGTVTNGAWEFYAPQTGWEIFDQNTQAFWVWNGTVWILSATLFKAAASVLAGDPLAITATATTTVSPAANSSFRISLNNVATVAVTINNGAYDGQEISILWVQGGTTSSTVTAASNVHGFSTPSAGLNSVSTQKFRWDVGNSTWYALGSGSQSM